MNGAGVWLIDACRCAAAPRLIIGGPDCRKASMSRWRPPQNRLHRHHPARDCHQRNSTTCGPLRPEVVRALAAAAEGDRSENTVHLPQNSSEKSTDACATCPSALLVVDNPPTAALCSSGAWLLLDNHGRPHRYRIGPDKPTQTQLDQHRLAAGAPPRSKTHRR